MAITRINPEALHSSPYFSQGVLVDSARTLYIGGQNGTDAQGVIQGDFAQQTEQAVRNLLAVLEAAGGAVSDIVKFTVILVDGEDVQTGFEVGMRLMAGFSGVITVMKVAGLGRPEALVELEAIAAL